MADHLADSQPSAPATSPGERWRSAAWILILLADAGFVAWGAMAAAAPNHLLGPGGAPILRAGYEGYSHASWPDLATAEPATAGYITLLFRMYGVFNVAFGLMAGAIAVAAFRRGEAWAWWALLVGNTMAFVSAMTYDLTVNAIGPFEMSEYLGLAMVYGALAVTASFLAKPRRPSTTRLADAPPVS